MFKVSVKQVYIEKNALMFIAQAEKQAGLAQPRTVVH